LLLSNKVAFEKAVILDGIFFFISFLSDRFYFLERPKSLSPIREKRKKRRSSSAPPLSSKNRKALKGLLQLVFVIISPSTMAAEFVTK
jgi:hypothetical protein